MANPAKNYRGGSIKFQSRPKTIDMTTRPWGELRAVRKGGGTHWYFVCPQGHENLMDAGRIRQAMRLHEAGQKWSGKPGVPNPVRCPTCKALESK